MTALETNTTLTELDLSKFTVSILVNNFIDDPCAKLIANFLATNTAVTTLNLGKKSFKSLAKNRIEDEGAKEIWGGLTKNSVLRNLSLAGNIIGRAGVQPLAKVLAENYTLLELNLGKIRF